MMHLTDRRLTPAGQAELADLHRRYLGMPLKDHDPECMRRWKKSAREFGRSAEPIEREDNSSENVLWKLVQQYR
jgi:hypothetical protein